MKREVVGDVIKHSGHVLHVEFMGPDYLSFVDGMQIGQFWLSPKAAIKGAINYVDMLELENKKIKERSNG